MESIFESVLLAEARVAFAKLQVREISIQTLCLAEDQIGITVIIAVCTELPALEIVRGFANDLQSLFGANQHGCHIFMILAAKRLGLHDDLVPGIHKRLSVVPLDHPMRSGH